MSIRLDIFTPSMSWHTAELSEALDITREIDEVLAVSSSVFDTLKSRRRIVLRASEASLFRCGLRCDEAGLIIRHLYRCLGLDENWAFRWRLEHKLVQALVFNHYCPGAIPVTRGLRRSSVPGRPTRLVLAEMFPDGFYIKPALGFASRDRDQGDQTDSLLSEPSGNGGIRPDMIDGDSNGLTSETLIVQERIHIQQEFRVHSFHNRVIEDLTFRRYEPGHIPAERCAPNRYVQDVLDSLPPGLLQHSLIGWDVAKTSADQYVIIEANLSGNHPVFEPGFHCSAYFLHPVWGPVVTARLLRHLEDCYEIAIDVQADLNEESSEEAKTYQWTRRWKDVLGITGPLMSLARDYEAILKEPSSPKPGWHRRFIGPLRELIDIAVAFESSVPPPRKHSGDVGPELFSKGPTCT